MRPDGIGQTKEESHRRHARAADTNCVVCNHEMCIMCSDSPDFNCGACQVLLYTKSGQAPDDAPAEMSEKDKADMAALDADADRIEKEMKQAEAPSSSS